MKKGELIAEFAKRTEMSGTAANSAVNTIIEIITERLKKAIRSASPALARFRLPSVPRARAATRQRAKSSRSAHRKPRVSRPAPP